MWDHGPSLVPLETHVARVLRDVGGYLLYREAYFGTEPYVSRVHYYESIGSYPWRLALRQSGASSNSWREVAQYPAFAEADAAARRHVRQGAVAVGRGEEWRASPPDKALSPARESSREELIVAKRTSACFRVVRKIGGMRITVMREQGEPLRVLFDDLIQVTLDELRRVERFAVDVERRKSKERK